MPHVNKYLFKNKKAGITAIDRIATHGRIEEVDDTQHMQRKMNENKL